MRRHVPLVLACLLAVAGVAAVPVAGHGNHLTADAQVVDDHVVVERSFLLTDGYAVVHLDQGGQMGRAIGHTAVEKGAARNYEIPVDREFLSQIDGTVQVWVTLHRSDGDGEFEPSQDTPLSGLQGQPPGVTVPIYVSSDGNANVVARDFGDQAIDEPAVTVRRVESNASGFVAVHADDGDVLGTTAVDAGVSENVSVDLDRSFYESLERNETAELTASLYRDDGDGTFDASADESVRVAGESVASSFSVTKVEDANETTSIVVTATGTAPPTTATTADSNGETTSSVGEDSAVGSTSTSPESSGGSPGFDVAAVVLAVLGVVAVLRHSTY
jgi:hypothetical protein